MPKGERKGKNRREKRRSKLIISTISKKDLYDITIFWNCLQQLQGMKNWSSKNNLATDYLQQCQKTFKEWSQGDPGGPLQWYLPVQSKVDYFAPQVWTSSVLDMGWGQQWTKWKLHKPCVVTWNLPDSSELLGRLYPAWSVWTGDEALQEGVLVFFCLWVRGQKFIH